MYVLFFFYFSFLFEKNYVTIDFPTHVSLTFQKCDDELALICMTNFYERSSFHVGGKSVGHLNYECALHGIHKN